jgi:hypothetical protein
VKRSLLKTDSQDSMHRLPGLAIVRIDLDQNVRCSCPRTAKLRDEIYVLFFCVLDSLGKSVTRPNFVFNVIAWSFWILGQGQDLGSPISITRYISRPPSEERQRT